MDANLASWLDDDAQYVAQVNLNGITRVKSTDLSEKYDRRIGLSIGGTMLIAYVPNNDRNQNGISLAWV